MPAADSRDSALVVLPSYNESQNIVALIEAILRENPAWDLCVVDDHSPDGTAACVEQLRAAMNQAQRRRVGLIVRPGKDGRGSAVRAGVAWGLERGDYGAFVEMDCDFSHPVADIARGLALLGEADVAMACRYPDGKIVGWPRRRRVLSYLANGLARVLISWSIADYTGGFRFYSPKAASLMCQRPQRHKGYIYLSETIADFLSHDLRIVCFPFVFVNRQRGVSNTGAREVAAALGGIFRIAWRYRTRRWR